MIIDDFDIPGFAISPHQTDPPLIVDSNAALTLAVAVQRFQTVAGRSPQISKLLRCVDCKKLSAGSPLNLRRQIADGVSGEDRGRALISKALNHGRT
jgi:hypothetical protein